MVGAETVTATASATAVTNGTREGAAAAGNNQAHAAPGANAPEPPAWEANVPAWEANPSRERILEPPAWDSGNHSPATITSNLEPLRGACPNPERIHGADASSGTNGGGQLRGLRTAR